MTRVRTIIGLLLLTLVSTEVQGQILGRWGRGRTSRPATRTASGRWCNSGTCEMCALAFGCLPGYAWRGNQVVWVGLQNTKPKPKPDPIKAELAATPQPIVDIMLTLANLKPNDTLLDPGCGDARFLVTAAQRHGCECIGIEIDPKTADAAEANIEAAGVADKVLIIRGDARKIRIDRVTVVVLYLFPDDIKAMRPNWPNARMVVSNSHEIPGVENQRLNLSVEGQEHAVYFWIKEKP